MYEALILAAASRVSKLDISLMKRRGDVCVGQQASRVPISPKEVNVVMVAAVKSRATVITGRLGGVPVELMLDSGSSVASEA